MNITREESTLLALLAAALGPQDGVGKKYKNIFEKYDPSPALFDQVARKHQLISILSQSLPYWDKCPDSIREGWEKETVSAVLQNYRRLLLAKHITGLYKEAGIECALLKGASTSKYYPLPELRKSGDLDILIKDLTQMEEAGRILKSLGFAKEDTQAHLHFASIHQTVYITPENIAIELHSMLAEPFDDEGVNSLLETTLRERDDYICRTRVLQVELPVLADYMHAFELLIHMLQHFLSTGFGLRLLCDWVVFWSREDIDRDQQRKYLELVDALGIRGFSDTITGLCSSYLGLSEKKIEWMGLPTSSVSGADYAAPGPAAASRPEADAHNDTIDALLSEILASGEFGVSGGGRMVALRGDGLWDYVREFHHQMKNNYPKASRIVPLWPLLWTANLAGFLYNNATMDRGSLKDIMKTAGERGRLVKKLEIFKR